MRVLPKNAGGEGELWVKVGAVSPYYEQNPPLCAPPAGAVSPYYEQNPLLSATPHASVRQNPLKAGFFTSVAQHRLFRAVRVWTSALREVI
ncbi:MAG: hypothetical protein ACPGWR_29640, partial [Ardenticatenaceae bacterium]